MALPEEQVPAIREDVAPAFAISLDEAKHRIAELQSFVKSQMVQDVDYGIIPGTPKPTLLKPGAEKLAMMYGFAISVDVTHRIEEWEHGFFSYECTCKLTNKRSGVVESIGVGSCNSKEARYRWRWVFDNELSSNVDTSLLTKKEGTSKNGRKWVQYRVENEDPYSLVNTILKMAKKRAVVDAVLSATRSSGLFTQDLEDAGPSSPPPSQSSPSAQKRQERRGASSNLSPDTKRKLIQTCKDYGMEPDEFNAWMDDQAGTHNWNKVTEEKAKELIEVLEDELAKEVPFTDEGEPK